MFQAQSTLTFLSQNTFNNLAIIFEQQLSIKEFFFVRKNLGYAIATSVFSKEKLHAAFR